MRQRKVKNEAERLVALEQYMVIEAAGMKGHWQALHKGFAGGSIEDSQSEKADLYLELGCGRGHFLVAQAEQNPDCFYIGAEGRSSIILRALELIDEKNLTNALCIPEYIYRRIFLHKAPAKDPHWAR